MVRDVCDRYGNVILWNRAQDVCVEVFCVVAIERIRKMSSRSLELVEEASPSLVTMGPIATVRRDAYCLH